MQRGKKIPLKIAINKKVKKKAWKQLKFSSSKKKVASVSKKGVVSAYKEGKTVIKIKAKEGKAKTKIKVNVSDTTIETQNIMPTYSAGYQVEPSFTPGVQNPPVSVTPGYNDDKTPVPTGGDMSQPTESVAPGYDNTPVTDKIHQLRAQQPLNQYR